jgi:hypothetical protein
MCLYCRVLDDNKKSRIALTLNNQITKGETMKKTITFAILSLLVLPTYSQAGGTGGAGPACSTQEIQGYQCQQQGAIYVDSGYGQQSIQGSVPCNSGVIPGTTTTVDCPVVASEPNE